jgi:hypothetical protein
MIVVNSTQSSLALAARRSPGMPRQSRPTRASFSTFHFRPSTSFFSHYYGLFCTAQNPNSFRFIFFRTLCTKHPGWGIPPSPIACSRLSISLSLATRLPRASKGHMPLSPSGATLTEKPGRDCRPTTRDRSVGARHVAPSFFFLFGNGTDRERGSVHVAAHGEDVVEALLVRMDVPSSRKGWGGSGRRHCGRKLSHSQG